MRERNLINQTLKVNSIHTIFATLGVLSEEHLRNSLLSFTGVSKRSHKDSTCDLRLSICCTSSDCSF